MIIYGAGDSGYLLVKELLQNRKYGLSPVGWIDDDETKQNMFLYGFKIYGGEEQLVSACEKAKATVVLISTKEIDESKERMLSEKLALNNIQVGRFNVNLYYK